MLIGRVIGTVVATQKHRKYEGAKLLLVQPTAADGHPRGTPLIAIDSVGAGVNERVLVVLEGRAAAEALRSKGAPVDTAIVGIIDRLEVTESQAPAIPPLPSAEPARKPRRRESR